MTKKQDKKLNEIAEIQAELSTITKKTMDALCKAFDDEREQGKQEGIKIGKEQATERILKIIDRFCFDSDNKFEDDYIRDILKQRISEEKSS